MHQRDFFFFPQIFFRHFPPPGLCAKAELEHQQGLTFRNWTQRSRGPRARLPKPPELLELLVFLMCLIQYRYCSLSSLCKKDTIFGYTIKSHRNKTQKTGILELISSVLFGQDDLRLMSSDPNSWFASFFNHLTVFLTSVYFWLISAFRRSPVTWTHIGGYK